MKAVARTIDLQDRPTALRDVVKPGQVFITPGRVYRLHALSVFQGRVSFLVIDDWENPSWEAAWLFELVDRKLPADWICSVWPAEEPQLVMGPEFIARDLAAYASMVECEADQIARFWKRASALKNMDTATPIPYSFIQSRASLTWPEVRWGFDEGWLSRADVVEHAMARLMEDSEPHPEVVELASLGERELPQVPRLLAKIVPPGQFQHSEENLKKWLCLALAWYYEIRDELADPLGKVEMIYADFGYPSQIKSLVRYEPPPPDYEPQAHSREENEARMHRKWREFVESCVEIHEM